MQDGQRIKQIVNLIADGLQQKADEKEIVRQLVEAGISAEDAPTLFAGVKSAFQQGVLSVVTGGASCPDGPPENPLLAEAFRVGRRRMQVATGQSLGKRLLIWVIVLVAIVFGAFRLFR